MARSTTPKDPTDTDPAGTEPTSTEPPRSFFRRHPLGTGIAAGAILVVLVSGLTAWGVGAAVTTSLTSSNAAMAPMPAATAPATKAGGLRDRADGRIAARATIASIDGSTWKVTTAKGVAATVTIDSTTQFGTKRMPATASSFAVGDTVLIVAKRSTGSTAGTLSGTAVRIVATKSHTATPGTEPTPMQTTAPTT